MNWRTEMNATATYFLRQRTLAVIKTPFHASNIQYFSRVDYDYKQLRIMARYSIPLGEDVYFFRQADYMYSNMLFNNSVNISPSMGLNYILPHSNKMSLEYSLYILNPSDVNSVSSYNDGYNIKNNKSRGTQLRLRYFMK